MEYFGENDAAVEVDAVEGFVEDEDVFALQKDGKKGKFLAHTSRICANILI